MENLIQISQGPIYNVPSNRLTHLPLEVVVLILKV